MMGRVRDLTASTDAVRTPHVDGATPIVTERHRPMQPAGYRFYFKTGYARNGIVHRRRPEPETELIGKPFSGSILRTGFGHFAGRRRPYGLG